MAYYSRSNLAYDFVLFEEPYAEAPSARRKKDTEDKPEAQAGGKQVNKSSAARKSAAGRRGIKKERRRKRNFGRIAVGVFFGLAVVVIIASIIHGQVQLTELNQEIIDAKKQLAEQQSVYTQLEMKVDSSISTSVVEQYAKEKLQMSKAANSQKEFISLSEGDKAEVSLKSDKNIFESIADAIASLWS